MLTLGFNIQLAKSKPTTWTVDDDGPADFSSIQGAINSPDVKDGDTIYVYNGIYYENLLVSKSLIIMGEDKDNTIIDGSGYEVVIEIFEDNVAINRITVRNGGWGSYFHSGSGIYCIYVESCDISDNIVSNSRYGISLWHSTNNTISSNTISDVEKGVSFGGPSYYNMVVSNSVSNGTKTGPPSYPVGIFFGGNDPSYLYYNTVAFNSVSNFSDACIYFNYPYHNTVVGNTVSNSMYGIHFQVGGSNNTVTDNTISDCDYGIRTDYADKNFVSENVVCNSYMAIAIGYESSFNTVAENNASDSGIGIAIMDHSSNNTVVNNIVSNNDYGMALLWQSNDTKIYHNNFINNIQQVLLIQSFNSMWDDGYPSGGNYWSDQYHGDCSDHFSGPSQDVPGSDGIVDIPYSIEMDNQDNYPLMEPYSPIPTTIDELKTEIEELGSEGEIDNQGIVKNLIAKLNVAQKLVDKGKIDKAKTILKAFIQQVQNLTGIHITVEAADILIESVEYIISHI